jgi:hypothetical protein
MDIPKQFFCRLFYALIFFCANHAVASIYKCTQADGSLQFSDVSCKRGVAEPIVLFENSALDSSAERANIARYNQRKTLPQRKSSVLIIHDSNTEERNARITAAEKKSSKKKKSKKKSKKIKKRKVKKSQPRSGSALGVFLAPGS